MTKKKTHKKADTTWCPKKGQLRSTGIHDRFWEGPLLCCGLCSFPLELCGLTGFLCPECLLPVTAQVWTQKVRFQSTCVQRPSLCAHRESLCFLGSKSLTKDGRSHNMRY